MMFYEWSNSGLEDTRLGPTPEQQARYERLLAKGKEKKAVRKATKWGIQLPAPPTGGGTPPGTGTTPTAPPSGMPTAKPAAEEGGGFDTSFLQGDIFGIPIWMVAVGVGAFLLLKKR